MADSFENDPTGPDPAADDAGFDAGFTPPPQPPSGNRPADNARRATPEDRVEETWFPQEGATDFLGLDSDLGDTEEPADEIRLPEAMMPAGHLEAPPVAAPAAAGPPTAGGGSPASWLLELDDEARAAAEAQAAEGEVDLPDPLDESWSEAPAPTGSLRKALVGGMAAVVVGALGLTIYRTLTVGSQPTETTTTGPVAPPPKGSTPTVELTLPGDPTGGSERGPADGSAPPADPSSGAATGTDPVAATPVETPGTEPAATTEPVAVETAPTPVDPGAAGPEPAGTEAGPEPGTGPAGGAPTVEVVGPLQPGPAAVAAGPANPAEWLRSRGLDPGAATGPFAAFLQGLGALAGTPLGALELSGGGAPAEPGATGAQPGGLDPLAEGASTRTGPVSDPALAALPPLPASVRLATEGELSNVWPGEAVPVEAIARGEKVLTPWVGRVRAVLNNGEIFEGRLYAVGQRRIWLTTGIGRMALMDHQVARIDQLSSDAGTASLGSAGSYDLVGLPRVRVRTPGGVFYGKVVAEDETTVTLITDEGARIKLPGDDVEPASETRTIVRSTALLDEEL